MPSFSEPANASVPRRSALAQVVGVVAALPARALLVLIWLYQRSVSPALPVLFGPSCGCRFSPTCSHYAADAVRTHGAVFGSLLALRRILRCSPLHPGGFDPVPPRRSRSRPVCTRSPSPAVPR